MADKYIRVSNFLHEKLKIKAAVSHRSLTDLAESYIWQILRKEEFFHPPVGNVDLSLQGKKSSGQKK